MRTFAYCRVSTTEQTTDNQILAIRNAGYDILDSRVVTETVSGSVPTSQRKGFTEMLARIEAGDTLVVLKLDRLGRDNIDIQQTVEKLGQMQIKIVCLDLPVPDLSTSEGKLMLQMFAIFAEFERNRIRERTIDGLNNAKESGVKLGRPTATSTTAKVVAQKALGLSQSKVAEALGISLPTVKRHWNKD